MSDLQIVLIILGGFIIAGVAAYNWMQERKLRDNITEDFAAPKKDILTEEFYVDDDPVTDKSLNDAASKSSTSNQLAEDKQKQASSDDESDIINKLKAEYESSLHDNVKPKSGVKSQAETNTAPKTNTHSVEAPNNAVLEKPAPAPAENHQAQKTDTSPVPVAAVDEPKPVLDVETADIEAHKNILPPEFQAVATSSLPDDIHSQIDLTAFLYASKNISGAALKTMMQTTFKELGSSVFVHGLDSDNEWHVINATATDDVSYKQIACSIQLADRSGPVPKTVLNKFQFAVEAAGLEQNAQVEWQGKTDPAKRAADLDKFCMDVDQLISVHLLQGDSPMHGTKLKGLAEASGMLLKAGKFCAYGEPSSDTPQFVLINADSQPFTDEGLRSNVVLGATFQIEIPKVSDSEQVFNDVIAIAQKMASSLGARIVDDNQKPLGDLQIEKIRQQLKVIHATMVARGVMPGSASSMRLFY